MNFEELFLGLETLLFLCLSIYAIIINLPIEITSATLLTSQFFWILWYSKRYNITLKDLKKSIKELKKELKL